MYLHNFCGFYRYDARLINYFFRVFESFLTSRRFTRIITKHKTIRHAFEYIIRKRHSILFYLSQRKRAHRSVRFSSKIPFNTSEETLRQRGLLGTIDTIVLRQRAGGLFAFLYCCPPLQNELFLVNLNGIVLVTRGGEEARSRIHSARRRYRYYRTKYVMRFLPFARTVYRTIRLFWRRNGFPIFNSNPNLRKNTKDLSTRSIQKSAFPSIIRKINTTDI